MVEKLSPAPGEYLLPLLQYRGVQGSELPDVIKLKFGVKSEADGQLHDLEIHVPISTLDAASILHGLTLLRDKGLIPTVASPPSTTKQ